MLELLVGAWAVFATIREDVRVVSDRWDQASSPRNPDFTQNPGSGTPTPDTRNPTRTYLPRSKSIKWIRTSRLSIKNSLSDRRAIGAAPAVLATIREDVMVVSDR